MTVSERATTLRVLRELHDQYSRVFDGVKAQDITEDCLCHLGKIYRFIATTPAKRSRDKRGTTYRTAARNLIENAVSESDKRNEIS